MVIGSVDGDWLVMAGDRATPFKTYSLNTQLGVLEGATLTQPFIHSGPLCAHVASALW